MKRKIRRNVAIVSAIFVATFSIMLIVNYFQVRGATPLQTEVIETLKEINDQNVNHPALQEQIRQLDLMARKAYFVRMEHLMTGVYILIGMLAVLILSTRLYFAKTKDIPAKEIDPIDEWAIKTHARKYIIWASAGLAATALIFALLSWPVMKQTEPECNEALPEPVTAIQDTFPTSESDAKEPETNSPSIQIETITPAAGNAVKEKETKETTQAVSVQQPATSSTVTHNAFRGNYANGVSSAKNLPVKWDVSTMTNIAWKKAIPRKGYNSPVINGNKVFFSGADEQVRELFCYDLNTGEQLWSLKAVNIPGSPSKLPEISDDTGLAASSVATDGKVVCAIFATGDMICADMNGKLLWAKNIDIPDIHYGYASSLLIYNHMVFVQYDHRKIKKVIALDLTTGNERWSKIRNEKQPSWSSPSLAFINHSPQLILIGNPGITAYNPTNGDQLWRVECMAGETASSACSADGIVFGGNEYAKLVAIGGADGRLLWESRAYLPEIASPVASKDHLYVATVYGVFAVFDAKTGALRKEHEFKADFHASPLLAEGKIYLFDRDGHVFILSDDDECKVLSSFDTGEKIFATPAFTDGKIVVKTENTIYCVINN